jgi:hypothetical protein
MSTRKTRKNGKNGKEENSGHGEDHSLLTGSNQPNPQQGEEFPWRCIVHNINFSGDACPECKREADSAAVENPDAISGLTGVAAAVAETLTAALAENNGNGNGHGKPPAEPIYQCRDCIVRTSHLPEMNEHLDGTKHSGYDTAKPSEPKTGDLFAELGPVIRSLRAKLPPEQIIFLNSQLAEFCKTMIEQQELAVLAKDRAKAAEVEMMKLAAQLRDPYSKQDVSCEWHVDMEANAKNLLRIDTGEIVETKPLSEEDRVRELARVAAANSQTAAATVS